MPKIFLVYVLCAATAWAGPWKVLEKPDSATAQKVVVQDEASGEICNVWGDQHGSALTYAKHIVAKLNANDPSKPDPQLTALDAQMVRKGNLKPETLATFGVALPGVALPPPALAPNAAPNPNSVPKPAVQPRFGVLPADPKMKSTHEQPPRIVALGDVHADPAATLAILRERGLIDEKGNWIGGKTHLVFAGDIVDRGTSSLPIIKLIMKLEKQAAAAGGKVHALIGNHDMLVMEGYLHYAKPEEMAEYVPAYGNTKRAKELVALGKSPEKAAFLAAFTGETDIAEWMRTRPTMVKIGDTLFVHAGVGAWPPAITCDEINATVQAWIKFHQGLGPEPPANTKWVWHAGSPIDGAGAKSPFWIREFAEGKLTPFALDEYLKAHGVARVVYGHTPTDSKKIERRHNGKAYAIDTNISYNYFVDRGGNLSALEIAGNLDANGKYATGAITDHYITRPTGHEPWIFDCVKNYKALP